MGDPEAVATAADDGRHRPPRRGVRVAGLDRAPRRGRRFRGDPAAGPRSRSRARISARLVGAGLAQQPQAQARCAVRLAAPVRGRARRAHVSRSSQRRATTCCSARSPRTAAARTAVIDELLGYRCEGLIVVGPDRSAGQPRADRRGGARRRDRTRCQPGRGRRDRQRRRPRRPSGRRSSGRPRPPRHRVHRRRQNPGAENRERATAPR